MFSDSACPTFKKILIASVLGVGVFLIPNGVQAQPSNSTTLQWAANQESDLAGYNVYHGTTSGSYGNPQNTGKTTTYQYVDLESNKPHFFAVTAYDTAGNESLPSLEVFKAIPFIPQPVTDPSPTPAPAPQPVTDPSPTPAPAPQPVTDPSPTPAPAPQPVTNPSPPSPPAPQPVTDPSPTPEFPILVNFQPSSSKIPPNFIKDDGSIFTASRGYGWDVLVNGEERNANVDQTIDTFVQISNATPITWNYTLPNGTYYISMVMGDPVKNQGPHWMSVEGMRLAAQIQTRKGQYFSVVEYPVSVQDNTLSLTLGGGTKGRTLLNFLIINSDPNLSQTMQTLTQSFGANFLAAVDNPGTVTKVNPRQLVKQEKKRQKVLAKQEKKRQKVSAKAQRVLNKTQRVLAKIEQKLVQHSDNSKVVALLNGKKERLLAKMQKFQEE